MKIVIVGLGYVGLSNAILLAQNNEVIGVDISQKRVDLVNERKSPIIDNEITNYLSKKDLNLYATSDLINSVIGADYVIISTPTNYDDITNFFDTSSIEAVIGAVLKAGSNACMVIRSTIPVGYIDDIRERLKTNAIIFSPEFLREGRALYDNLYPSRIIVGEKSERAQEFANLLVHGALKDKIEVQLTGSREAEAIKLFANTYLAMRIAFFNELDSYALSANIDSREIITGVSLDPRIGNFYNNPSFGYGGYCLPKDTRQLLSNYQNIPQNMIRATVDANKTRLNYLADHILKLKPKMVGIYRLVMKVDSDNFRHSSIQGIMMRLKENGIQIVIHEPTITEDSYSNIPIENDLSIFKNMVDIIVSNRCSEDLYDVNHKLFTRDIFGND